MEAKQAHGAARAMVRALRDFEQVEAVLDTAVQAEQRQVAAEERIRVLSTSAKKWEAAVEAAQAVYAKEQNAASAAAEKARVVHEETMLHMNQAAEAAIAETKAAVVKALTEGKVQIKTLTAECRALEGRRDELKRELNKARDAHAEMLEKLGVRNG